MTTLEQVRAQRDAVLAIARRYGVRRVRLFGSVVRGEDRPDSDVDVLAEFEDGRSLLDLAGFGLDLEDLLSRKVDVVSEGGLSPYIEKRVLREAVPL
jgi:predicted nucleotidyltransferase